MYLTTDMVKLDTNETPPHSFILLDLFRAIRGGPFLMLVMSLTPSPFLPSSQDHCQLVQDERNFAG